MQALKPALTSQKRARELLDRFWRDKAAIVWTTVQVHRAANEHRTVLTEKDAQLILQTFIRLHNHQHGLRWSDLMECIQASGRGRDIRPAELRNLVKHDQLTIDPP
jgi:hypothetical protein